MTRCVRRAWRPLLQGEIGRKAEAVLDDIVSALSDDVGCAEPSLAEGWTGRALLFGYFANHRPGRGHLEQTTAALNRALDGLDTGPADESLFGGWAGLGWAVEHLQARLGYGPDDRNEPIDELLMRLLAAQPWPGQYDLVSGLAGLGVYSLERWTRPGGRTCLARIIQHLADRAEPRGPGLAWRTSLEMLSAEERARYPRGIFDLGVAHGAPAVATVLAGACAAGVSVDQAHPLLDGVVRWMMARQLPHEQPSTFTYREHEGPPDEPARAAWCYGDPGIAVSLYVAGEPPHDPHLKRDALAIGRRAARRSIDDCGVVEAGLCHGAAGLALLFHRLWQASGESLFAEAALGWYRRILELQVPDRGFSGFRSLGPPVTDIEGDEDARQWREDGSFLNGACGVGLVLLSGLSPIEPCWDRVLTASLPAFTPVPAALGRDR